MNVYRKVLEDAEAIRRQQVRDRSAREEARLAKFLAGRDGAQWKRQGRRVVLR